MTARVQDTKNILADIIDRYGLEDVLRMMAEIAVECTGSDHTDEWNRDWNLAERRLTLAANFVSTLKVN